jgi:aerobic-type carbon monoxide dehydrogenase small subunit (CoxS/CutS family)
MVTYNELSEMLLCTKLNKINGNSMARTLDFAILHHIFITDWMKSLTPKEGLKVGSCGSCTI